jgi:hypothetical protein
VTGVGVGLVGAWTDDDADAGDEALEGEESVPPPQAGSAISSNAVAMKTRGVGIRKV